MPMSVGSIPLVNQHFSNLLDPYGGVESWSKGAAVAPDGYTLVGGGATIAREGAIVKHANFSAKLTRVGNDCYLSISVPWTSYYQSRVLILGVWVYATVADRARVTIYDGVGSSSSSLHDGGSDWDFLTVTRTLNAAASEFTVRLECVTGNTAVYFDGAILVEGTVCPAYMPAVKEVWLTTSLTDTDFNGDSFSTSEADIDLSTFGNGCPPGIKAVYVSLYVRDSGSGGGVAKIYLGPGGIAIGTAVAKAVILKDLTNSPSTKWRGWSGWIPCSSSGDIRYKITATGASTFSVWMIIWGYVLGE